MGSVMDYVDCPQCGGQDTMFRDYYYKSGEEYWMCKRCGKHGKVEIVRDDNGNVIFDEQGKVSYNEEDLKGYGCAKIATVGHGATLSCFSNPITEEDKKEFLKILEEKEIDKEHSYLSSWNDETESVEMLYGKDPNLYSEDDEE